MKRGECKLANGNCTEPSDDGYAVQCVGAWAEEKHDILRRYIDATAGPRGKYLKPSPSAPRPGGAAFVDLFAGPGRARVRESKKFIEGTPIIALRHSRAAFSKLIFCELDDDNLNALRARVSNDPRVTIVEGDCNATIGRVVAEIPKYGLNMALIDPFGMAGLDFETIRALASVRRMDLLIHFPTMDGKRNYDQDREKFARFVGTDQFELRGPKDVPRLIEVMKVALAPHGYRSENVRSIPVTNNQKAVLYHLVFASKDALGDKIWKSITDRTASGQRELF